jgi:hypothetical protein
MRIFKNAWFVRFARAQKISDDVLREAILRVESGQVDADLGKESPRAIERSFCSAKDTGRFSFTDLLKVVEIISARMRKSSSKVWPGTSCVSPIPS